MDDTGKHYAMKNSRYRLDRWFSSQLGTDLLQSEQRLLDEWLPGLFGYHIVQMGQCPGWRLMQASRIGHKAITAITADDATSEAGVALVCEGEQLPLAADSVDVLLLPHVLEFERHPHQVLRECERVLISEGHVLIFTFNPWSLWGLWRLLLGWRKQPPWTGHFFSAWRLQDWLHLLGFEIIETRRLHYRPPINHKALRDKLTFMEKLGQWCWPWLGGVHAILARKHVISVTPIREPWRQRRRVAASGLAEPTACRDG